MGETTDRSRLTVPSLHRTPCLGHRSPHPRDGRGGRARGGQGRAAPRACVKPRETPQDTGIREGRPGNQLPHCPGLALRADTCQCGRHGAPRGRWWQRHARSSAAQPLAAFSAAQPHPRASAPSPEKWGHPPLGLRGQWMEQGRRARQRWRTSRSRSIAALATHDSRSPHRAATPSPRLRFSHSRPSERGRGGAQARAARRRGRRGREPRPWPHWDPPQNKGHPSRCSFNRGFPRSTHGHLLPASPRSTRPLRRKGRSAPH